MLLRDRQVLGWRIKRDQHAADFTESPEVYDRPGRSRRTAAGDISSIELYQLIVKTFRRPQIARIIEGKPSPIRWRDAIFQRYVGSANPHGSSAPYGVLHQLMSAPARPPQAAIGIEGGTATGIQYILSRRVGDRRRGWASGPGKLSGRKFKEIIPSIAPYP